MLNIKFFISPRNTLGIETTWIKIENTYPVLNGAVLKDCQVEILQNEASFVSLRCRDEALASGVFTIEAGVDPEGKLWLRYALEGLAESLVLDSFGIQFQAVENIRSYLRNGYSSWDGSFYVQPEALGDFEPYEGRPEQGYAMTQLLPRQGEGSLVFGFDRHDRFQQTFTFDTQAHPPSLTVLTLWDQKDRHSQAAGSCRCESERLVIFEHPGVEDALREWARLVAAASPTPPRLSGPPITGWCSWYNLYGYINEENILEHLHAAADLARRENLPMRVFQIDDGFTPEMGDWLEIKPQFPRGMKPILDDIRSAGFIPGLWIAPFLVGCRSHLYRDHPDWVVKDRETGGPLVHWRLYGEFRWHKRSEEYYILDATHPEAFNYLRNVFRTWRWEWGCEYFKTDFMYFGSEYGPQRAEWHAPGKTRIEIWRGVAEMIRQEIGEALWLGCGCPLWTPVGLVDAIRIGSDVGVQWRGHLSAESLLRDQATRNFANQILWQSDPDCVLLRERFHHLTETEVRSLAIYAGMSGGVMMTSDHLGELSSDRLNLWRLILGERRSSCSFPFLGQTDLFYGRLPDVNDPRRVVHEPRPADPVLVQVRAGAGQEAAIFIFNTGENTVQRSYRLEALGLREKRYIFDWTLNRVWPGPVDSVSVTLNAHEGALLFASPSPIENAPDRLPE